MPKITAKALNNAMHKAEEESLRLDKALGLPHLEVHDGYLVRIEVIKPGSKKLFLVLQKENT